MARAVLPRGGQGWISVPLPPEPGMCRTAGYSQAGLGALGRWTRLSWVEALGKFDHRSFA